MTNYEYYKNNKKLLEICTGINFNYILEGFKSWCNILSIKEKQEIVLKELDRFDNMNLNNDYYVSDRHKLIKELENDLNCDIDYLNFEVKEK